MKVPVFYIYPYAHLKETEFVIRYEENQITFYCRRLKAHKKRIRTAWALLIRGQIITAQPAQSWKLNRKGTYWKFYDRCWSRPRHIGSIPSHEVYWALGTSPNSADVETYHGGRIIRWRIVNEGKQCKLCGIHFVVAPHHRDHFICERCWKRLEKLWDKLPTVEYSKLLHPERITAIARQDRSRNLRWIRKFSAKGNFTSSEFKALCQIFGNVCLRCEKKGDLVADHVIPLAKGGRNDITNIQPLCKTCNGIKGIGSTDYRKKWQKF
jgi:5-methylcytosine-specific restriction endonuclease McrA